MLAVDQEIMQSTWLPKVTKSQPWICLSTHWTGVNWLAHKVSVQCNMQLCLKLLSKRIAGLLRLLGQWSAWTFTPAALLG